MSRSRLRVVVAGMIAGVTHQPGATWAVLQYVLGLRALGHDVLVVEPVEAGALRDAEVTSYFGSVVDRFDLSGRAALVDRDTRGSVGVPWDELLRVASGADVLLDISGVLAHHELLEVVPLRVYVDVDPAFTQLWHTVCDVDVGLGGHDRFVTVGTGVGSESCAVPTAGLDWIPTFPPVVLEHWPVAEETVHDALTTVANWRGYGSITHDGVHYGQKAHSLRELIELPSRACEAFLLALAIDPGETEDVRALQRNGWRLVEADSFPRSTDDYRRFVRGSRAEFGVAKSGYVASRSGWFSDRSACYLASGRPVIAQDTGWDAHLPCGEGLLSFRDVDSAADAVEDIRVSYEAHSKAARDIADEHLDAAKVLPRLLDAVGATS